ncbi:sensor histidine kinase [Actinokineospora sp.]|uniref:sensor histidine kinase n=1 Tax=Actinokineospora sp. TaxID=1872133 RepID=UPI004037C475
MVAGGRRSTVRVRATAAAVVVVGVVLLGGSIALLAVLRDSLATQVRADAQLRAGELAADVAAAGIMPTLADGDGELVQIRLDGAVVAANQGGAFLAGLTPGQSAEVGVPGDDERFLAVAVAAETGRGRFVVQVARSLDDVADPTQAVVLALVVGLPVLLAVVGATTWLAVGRALAPVDAIRREVEEISAAELHRRVPDPPGPDEIARLAATMNRMLDRLERAAAKQRRFVSDASHELRSPVAAIRQHAEVALAHPETTTVAELAETVLAEDLRVQYLVEDLLFLARTDEETAVAAPRPVDLDDLVFAEARRLRETTGLRISTAEVSAGRVSGDAGRLARVLRNLGDNAARHAGGQVCFALARRDGAVVLHIADDGPGIPEADRERVFARFVRLDAARARDGGGSGLGLAIVAEVIRAHGGTVTAGTGSLCGARIEVVLPAAD